MGSYVKGLINEIILSVYNRCILLFASFEQLVAGQTPRRPWQVAPEQIHAEEPRRGPRYGQELC